MRIQRRANWLIETPAGRSVRSSSTASKSDAIVDAGKSLAHIEGLAVAIEIAMIVRCEGRIATQLSRQQATGKRHTRQDADALFFGARKNIDPPDAAGNN